MNTAQHMRVRDLYLRAQDVAPEDRDALIRDACPDDPAVRAEALRLLGAQRAKRVAGEGAEARLPIGAVARDRASLPEGRIVLGPDTAAEPAAKGAEDAAPTAPKVGDVVLGRYELREVVGAGGFGSVFRAHDRILRETVAVKVVDISNADLRRWHARELSSLRRGRVPGVVDLLAAGHADGRAIVVMSFVQGQAFPGADVGTDAVPQILARGVSLLEAVAHLHAAGIYHRDLKPDNVLVSRAGVVTLVDLGIAEDATEADVPHEKRAIVGTPSYIAPERLRGAGATVASELYSVGVILVRALTDELPSTWTTLPPRAPGLSRYSDAVVTALRRKVTRGTTALLDRLLADDPRDRPATAQEAIDALRAECGTSLAFNLPHLGGERTAAVVDAIVAAVREGRSLDVAGPPGSGRSRAIDEAESKLRDAGYVVHRVAAPADRGLAPWAAAEIADITAVAPAHDDEELARTLRRRVADGVAIFVDDVDALDPATRALVDALRPHGAVVRAVRESDGPCVHLADLTAHDLAGLVAGPARLFHMPTEIASILWSRTDGRPGAVVREVRSWTATGLASWGGRLRVTAAQLDRLRRLSTSAARCPSAAPEPAVGVAAEVWTALSLVGEPLDVAALGHIVGHPPRVIDPHLADLVGRGVVAWEADGGRRAVARCASPDLADLPDTVRQALCARAADRVPPRSEARFRLLIAAGRHAAAWRAAHDAAGVLVTAGNLARAVNLLDEALSTLRRNDPDAAGAYAELLGSMADAALGRATRDSIDLALYHAQTAPQPDARVEAWIAVLDAAAAQMGGDAARSLALIDAAGEMPTDAHRIAAHIVANHAGRMTRSLPEQRARVTRVAEWARRSGGAREVRARLSIWTAWLRYEEAAQNPALYVRAASLFGRGARLTRRARSRASFLCGAATAAIEAGDLPAAARFAGDALVAARRIGDTVNEARAELLGRQCAYRVGGAGGARAVGGVVGGVAGGVDGGVDGGADGADGALVEAAAYLDRDATRGMIRLTEAAFAWRARRLEIAGGLAAAASEDLNASGFRAAAALAAALATACGGRGNADLLATLRADGPGLEPPGIEAQGLALAIGVFGLSWAPPSRVDRARHWCRNARLREMRREVLSPAEALSRLDDGSATEPSKRGGEEIS